MSEISDKFNKAFENVKTSATQISPYWNSIKTGLLTFIFVVVCIQIFFSFHPELGNIRSYIGEGTSTNVIIAFIAAIAFMLIYGFGSLVQTSFADTQPVSMFWHSLIIAFIIGLIWTFIALFSPKSSGSPQDNIQLLNMFGYFVLAYFIIYLIISYLKLNKTANVGFSEITKYLADYKQIIFLILYIVFIIVYFTIKFEKNAIIENINNFFVPFLLLFGVYLFYRGFGDASKDVSKIKSILTFMCLLFFMGIVYILDPNQLISTYFGYTMVISILIALFGLCYVTSVISARNTSIPTTRSDSSQVFTQYGVFFLFIIFLITVTIGITQYPGKISVLLISLILLVSIIWIIALLWVLFSNSKSTFDLTNLNEVASKIGIILSGLSLSGMFIYWLVYTIQNLSGKNGIWHLILNLIVVLIVLSIMYKILKFETAFKTNKIFSLLINIIFYIPCLFVTISENITALRNQNFSQLSYVKLLVGIIIAYVIYFRYSFVERRISNQGGQLLLKGPISLNSENVLEGLTTNMDKFNYNYAISCWVYLDSVNKNNVDTYFSIINYGEKPNISYNPVLKKLKITTTDKRKAYLVDNFLLQKWNNIIVNYSGGTVDIFINGDLIRSFTNIAPYMAHDNLVVGQENGVNGGICSVVYFDEQLTSKQIYYVYNSLKNKTPPLVKFVGDDIKDIMAS